MTSASTRSKAKSSKRSSNDAFALLKNDHKTVQQMFDEYADLCEQEAESATKQALASRICVELKVHTQIEEEIFYPALRDAFDDPALLDEAEVEHQSAKDLIEQIEGAGPDDDLYDAKVTVLGEYIKHHVKEEEGEIFKEAKSAGIDADALGEAMAERADELRGDLEAGDELEEEEDDVDASEEDEEDGESGRRRARRG